MSTAQEKKIELENIINATLPKDVNQKALSTFIVEHFATISEPEVNNRMEMIVLGTRSGLGGGKSSKPGNIRLNWKKLLAESPEHYLTIIGAATSKYLIPVAALVVWNKVWALREINILESHAMVIAALWDMRDENNYVDGSGLLIRLNAHFKTHTTRQISKEEFDKILSDLSDLSAIKLKSDGRIWLCEWVQKPYY